MKRTNKYLDNLVTKILNETLEEKANQVMARLGGSDDFDYVAEGETCKCGSKEFYEGMCVECGTMKGEVLEKDCMEGDSGCMGEGKSYELELDEFEDPSWFEETDRINKELDRIKMMPDKSSEKRKPKRPSRPIRHKERFKDDFDLKFDDEGEMEEGNAFTDALRKTPKGGKFKLGGKEYTDNSSLEETLYRLSDDKGFELFTEDEIIDLIENIIIEEKEKSNIKRGEEPKGLTKYREAYKGSGKENKEYLESVAKKMTDYIKDGSKGKYETNPKHFPKGNGQLAKMDKMAYEIPDEGKKFNLDIAGLNIPDYDEIMPDKKKIKGQIEGDNINANNPEWANAEDTGVNKMFADIFDEDPLGKLKDKSYNRYDQPVVLNKSKGKKDKKGLNLSEEFDRMKGLITYDRKTQ